MACVSFDRHRVLLQPNASGGTLAGGFPPSLVFTTLPPSYKIFVSLSALSEEIPIFLAVPNLAFAIACRSSAVSPPKSVHFLSQSSLGSSLRPRSE